MDYADRMERLERLKTNLAEWMLRHSSREALKHGEYRRICRTLHMVEFS